ncbi:transcriptional regulator (GntR family protein) [Desulforapulum autotrophicum HRM2]|uniref:Transcriptional regulator (GntR family protein) n=1 Tax=Desulforapulum autotrophicum (strain ATCC 43914 / DSM 3382 / VKM B-1955 / HRM2) TaxID=177437 RepID=C0Q9S3_DESAH|nr:GntR family transcriptional regulator [Desulforapulum autotrophicum]ACN14637.1 transcriptional regulator (GntR family protein) [Desulforapulum autotrophicum HRM2]
MAKTNLDEFAYKAILDLIFKNHFKPGEFLFETELSESLGLSRTPVRHALGQLIAEGFLDKKKKKGCFIPLATPEDARHIFYAREHIEGLAAASAARCATDEEVQYLYGLIEKENKVQNFGNHASKLLYVEINEDFHLSIARFSQNKYLEHYCRHAFCRSNVYIFFFDKYYSSLTMDSQVQEPQQHLEITAAIENRNEEKAEHLMRQHVRTTFEQLFIKL